ncbi:TetR family transcriptional regulator [Actinorhabdospora filicis]|uniref:TetR family transcriptional regulator n=1 Tax=Actinorhabdospora filicis TaxID=1785913 RepID=A0A9W6SKS2_9ACTN|nr:TetR/AcrR family transcriptional regulator [Actinorhabdospora filicis]GLZ77612.1 TetR family transcriptional regulator [Actinorhabdospora filicis]
MTNSVQPRGAEKRRRLTAAATAVLHRQGVERTTLADIAKEADVPVGNVYYYFKTKDDLVQAALGEHSAYLKQMTDALDAIGEPRERLKALVAAWVEQKETAARYGCPTGTLTVELDKRADGILDVEAGRVVRQLLDWVAAQFTAMGHANADDLALTLVSGYQGMSMMAGALRDPEVMTREGARLVGWLDGL